MKKITVSGSIDIPQEIRNKKFNSFIKIVDTSFEDAPAITIAETRIDSSAFKLSKKKYISFELDISVEIIPSHDYTVSVLLDMDGDGVISTNDYIQKQSYRAISQGKPMKGLVVELQKI